MTMWTPPPRRRLHLAIAFPSSIVDTEATLQLKTLKVGQIARAAAIHRVDEIIVYGDDYDRDKVKTSLILDILKYIITPPYLRRKYIPLKKTLRYAGTLPPLRVPSHVKDANIKDDEYREAMVIVKNGRLYADVGIKKLIPIKGKVSKGFHVVKIYKKGRDFIAVPASKHLIPYYWGFIVKTSNSLSSIVNRDWDLKIATSRLGDPILKVHKFLVDKYYNSKSILIAFGSPHEGLWEIARKEGWSLEEKFDLIINFIPDQGVETVRTEEALHAVLEYFTLIETSQHLV